MEALVEIKQQDLLGHINSLNWCQQPATFTRLCFLAHASWLFNDKCFNMNFSSWFHWVIERKSLSFLPLGILPNIYFRREGLWIYQLPIDNDNSTCVVCGCFQTIHMKVILTLLSPLSIYTWFSLKPFLSTFLDVTLQNKAIVICHRLQMSKNYKWFTKGWCLLCGWRGRFICEMYRIM